jgi:hypothetical protein
MTQEVGTTCHARTRALLGTQIGDRNTPALGKVGARKIGERHPAKSSTGENSHGRGQLDEPVLIGLPTLPLFKVLVQQLQCTVARFTSETICHVTRGRDRVLTRHPVGIVWGQVAQVRGDRE